VKPTDLDSFQIGFLGLLQLHRDVGFETKHVGGTHFAFQIHQHAGIGPLKFNQSWRQPKCAEPLGNGEPDLAA
jgi:hypothetical protein